MLSKTFFAILLSELKLFLSPNPVLTFLFCTLVLGEKSFTTSGVLADGWEDEATSKVASIPRSDMRNGTTKGVYLISGMREGGETGVVVKG